MVYRIDFDKAPDVGAMVIGLAETSGTRVVPVFADRPGRYRFEPWDITLDVDWQVHLSVPTRPDADPALAVERLYLLARDLESLGLRGLDRELATPIADITSLDAPAREFAAQIEKSKSPVPDAMPPANTDRVPWPTNWNDYTPFERIGGRIPSEDLAKQDALARFEQVTSSINERITELGKLTRTNGFELGASPEHIEQLTDWLVSSVEDNGCGKLRAYWHSVFDDISIFLGETLTQRIPYLKWTFVAKGSRRTVENYQGTVIGGFTETLSPTLDVFDKVAAMAGITYAEPWYPRDHRRLAKLINTQDEPEPKYETPESLKAYIEGRAVDVGP